MQFLLQNGHPPKNWSSKEMGFLNPKYSLPSERGGAIQLGRDVTPITLVQLCTPARERHFLSFLICVSPQVAPPLSPIGESQ